MAIDAIPKPSPHHGPYYLRFISDDAPECFYFDFSCPGTEERYQTALNRVQSPVFIEDIRGLESGFTLFRNGFQYVQDAPPLELGGAAAASKTAQEIADVLVPAAERLVKEMTGPCKIVTAGYHLRNMLDDPRRQMDHHGPSYDVHCDFSATGAVQYLQSTLFKDDPAAVAAVSGKRILVVNVWRPLLPIKRDPLAVCDWQSIDPSGSSLVPWKVSFDDGARQNESLKMRRHEDHRWYHLKGQLPSEPLVFLCFDSSRVADGGMTMPHSAFVDPVYADSEEARVSFEIKMFCFIDETDCDL